MRTSGLAFRSPFVSRVPMDWHRFVAFLCRRRLLFSLVVLIPLVLVTCIFTVAFTLLSYCSFHVVELPYLDWRRFERNGPTSKETKWWKRKKIYNLKIFGHISVTDWGERIFRPIEKTVQSVTLHMGKSILRTLVFVKYWAFWAKTEPPWTLGCLCFFEVFSNFILRHICSTVRGTCRSAAALRFIFHPCS